MPLRSNSEQIAFMSLKNDNWRVIKIYIYETFNTFEVKEQKSLMKLAQHKQEGQPIGGAVRNALCD